MRYTIQLALAALALGLCVAVACTSHRPKEEAQPMTPPKKEEPKNGTLLQFPLHPKPEQAPALQCIAPRPTQGAPTEANIDVTPLDRVLGGLRQGFVDLVIQNAVLEQQCLDLQAALAWTRQAKEFQPGGSLAGEWEAGCGVLLPKGENK